nr:hypothetical protein [Bradyrhizobium diazoefficiens]
MSRAGRLWQWFKHSCFAGLHCHARPIAKTIARETIDTGKKIGIAITIVTMGNAAAIQTIQYPVIKKAVALKRRCGKLLART